MCYDGWMTHSKMNQQNEREREKKKEKTHWTQKQISTSTDRHGHSTNEEIHTKSHNLRHSNTVLVLFSFFLCSHWQYIIYFWTFFSCFSLHPFRSICWLLGTSEIKKTFPTEFQINSNAYSGKIHNNLIILRLHAHAHIILVFLFDTHSIHNSNDAMFYMSLYLFSIFFVLLVFLLSRYCVF